jgi:hypothetical protein
MTMVSHDTPDAARVASPRPGVGWALRRALLGVVILFVFVAGAAWLLHNSIDPVQDALAGQIASDAGDARQ